MKNYTLIAPCFFGLEKIVAREIQALDFEIIKTEDGRVTFKTDSDGIAKANMWLRTAERVLWRVAEFEAYTFEELFQGVKSIDWQQYLPYGVYFPVSKVSSVRSELFSKRDIQAITKKAIVEKMKLQYGGDEYGMIREDEEAMPIFVFIHKNKVTISIDTSGLALHKRGYREVSTAAPIRETLAAAMISLTPWRPGKALVDPMCGSGTILIEAAMKGRNMAPGINREFISENWRIIDKDIWRNTRKLAYDQINDLEFKLSGSDIDPEAIEIAKENAEIAGVANYIDFSVADMVDFTSKEEYGFIITNPPYGERLEDEVSVERLYAAMGRMFKKLPTWSLYAITSFEDFEFCFKRKAERKRKIYNGMLRSDYYQYPGPRPPRAPRD
ncbi:MAG: THUMP domain-containing class I SAM-dependent RNA methyltransferase [Culicoidibacterales bacterium]